MPETFTPPRSIDVALLNQIDSFAKAGSLCAGDLRSTAATASFRVEGQFEGNIDFSAGGVVHIAAGATFSKGTITADYIYVEGIVHGDVIARRCVEVVSSAEVIGTIAYSGDIDLHKNVRIRGGLNFLGMADAPEVVNPRYTEASNDLQAQIGHAPAGILAANG